MICSVTILLPWLWNSFRLYRRIHPTAIFWKKLGNTQAFGQSKYRQYVTDNERIIKLYFESKDDLKPETSVFIHSDYVLESYPEQRHCTKIIILK